MMGNRIPYFFYILLLLLAMKRDNRLLLTDIRSEIAMKNNNGSPRQLWYLLMKCFVYERCRTRMYTHVHTMHFEASCLRDQHFLNKRARLRSRYFM